MIALFVGIVIGFCLGIAAVIGAAIWAYSKSARGW